MFVGSPPQACMRGLEWEAGSAALRELLEEAAQDLTLERLSQAREEALRGGSPAGGGGGPPRDRGDHRAELTFHFPEVRCRAFWQLRERFLLYIRLSYQSSAASARCSAYAVHGSGRLVSVGRP